MALVLGWGALHAAQKGLNSIASVADLENIGGDNGYVGSFSLEVDVVTCATNECENIGEGSIKCVDVSYDLVDGTKAYKKQESLCSPQYFYNTPFCVGNPGVSDCSGVKSTYTDP